MKTMPDSSTAAMASLGTSKSSRSFSASASSIRGLIGVGVVLVRAVVIVIEVVVVVLKVIVLVYTYYIVFYK